ncbi:SRPBCC family protein [Rhodococcus sp. X156]|uniref:SRPBCC family protein n=1 Tax=Rhodococcus sp. X156 TaxID=2499145 RepID=UPI001F49C90A|nr:SRPBCC family protein [Rhodococcus sp. X156]
MITVTRTTTATPEQVWDVLNDGWLYVGWVVGTSTIREVDKSWPQPESKLYHSVGVWPLTLNDSTSVVSVDPGRCLELQARGNPGGEARVVVTTEPRDGGTLVTMAEDAIRGPGRLVPYPLRWASIWPRNTESLRRLCALAEGRAR